jgi:hypothetical protein
MVHDSGVSREKRSANGHGSAEVGGWASMSGAFWESARAVGGATCDGGDRRFTCDMVAKRVFWCACRRVCVDVQVGYNWVETPCWTSWSSTLTLTLAPGSVVGETPSYTLTSTARTARTADPAPSERVNGCSLDPPLGPPASCRCAPNDACELLSTPAHHDPSTCALLPRHTTARDPLSSPTCTPRPPSTQTRCVANAGPGSRNPSTTSSEACATTRARRKSTLPRASENVARR